MVGKIDPEAAAQASDLLRRYCVHGSLPIPRLAALLPGGHVLATRRDLVRCWLKVGTSLRIGLPSIIVARRLLVRLGVVFFPRQHRVQQFVGLALVRSRVSVPERSGHRY